MTSEQTLSASSPSASSTSASAPSSVPRRDHRWIALAVIALAQLMVVLDATIVNIALPAAQADLGFNTDERQWVVTAYSLAFGSLLLLGGRLGDLFGRKNLFIIGLVGFAAASVIGGLSSTFGMLVAARALQGVFGAMLAPAALGMLTTTFRDPKERGRAFAIFGSIAGSGAALGLLLGGVLTEYTTWRWCLYVNVIFAVLGVIGALAFMQRPPRVERPRIDVPGVVTVTLGLVAIVWGFSNAETNGWDSLLTYVSLGIGVVLVAVFVVIQTRVEHPLLPLRIVLDRDRGGSLLAIGLVAIGMFGIFLFLTYYMEQTLGFSSLQTGLGFLPMPAAIMVSSTQIGGRLLPRIGPKILIFAGGLTAGIGLLLLLRTEADSTYAGTVLPALIVIGLGMGTIFSSAINTATSGVARQDAGVASASVNTMQQIGGSIGTAVLSAVFTNVVANQLDGQQFTSKTDALAAQADATLVGYHVAFGISAGVLFLVAVLSGLIINRQKVRVAKLEAMASTMTGSIPTQAH